MTHLNRFYLPNDLKKFHLADKFASEEEIRIHFICRNTFWQAYIHIYIYIILKLCKTGISGNLIFKH